MDLALVINLDWCTFPSFLIDILCLFCFFKIILGPGVTSIGYGGFVPYPGYEYFLNDLWYYNISDGYWYNTSYPSTMSVPAPRRDMVLLILHDELFLHGNLDT